jgi:hypothetical protein
MERLVDWLFPVSLAVDIATVVALVGVPFLCIRSFLNEEWPQARVRVAYLCYILCAIVVASFVLHLVVDGGEVLMVFLLFLAPFAVAAVVAIAMTLAAGSNRTLRVFAAATIVVALVQLLAEIYGYAGALGTAVLVVDCAYAVLVLGAGAYRRSEWRRRPTTGQALR